MTLNGGRQSSGATWTDASRDGSTRIAKLYDYFGPGIASPEVEALVASPETAARLSLANKLRADKGYPQLELVTVDWTRSEDGQPISSTRIRKGEIDADGKLTGAG